MSETFAPKNRNELVERLTDLRQQGVLDASEEERLLQHYDEMLRDVEQEKANLHQEYQRRVEADGQDAADAWLREQAFELGRRQGEDTRRIVNQLRVVTG